MELVSLVINFERKKMLTSLQVQQLMMNMRNNLDEQKDLKLKLKLKFRKIRE